MTVEQRLGRTVALRRLQTLLLGALAAVALILAVIGAYGVIHQSVVARTQEIGIRMALGANAPSVSRMVLAAGLAPAVAGLGLGLLGSLALSRTMSHIPLRDERARSRSSTCGVTVLLLVDHDDRLPGAGTARLAVRSDDRAAARVISPACGRARAIALGALTVSVPAAVPHPPASEPSSRPSFRRAPNPVQCCSNDSP